VGREVFVNSSSILGSVWFLCALFGVAALVELWRERAKPLYFARGFVLSVAIVGAVIVMLQGGDVFGTHTAALPHDDLAPHLAPSGTYISYIHFSAAYVFSVLSVGLLIAAILFCPSAPLARVKMSRILAMEALIFGLIHVQEIESFLMVGIALTGGLIFSNWYYCKNLLDDELRFLRARCFAFYQGAALLAMSVSLLLRVLDHAGVVPYTSTLGFVDLTCLCVASAISLGIFPFHGWVLPFFSSPRATVFLPVICIQMGLIFFFRVYAPIVSTYNHHSLLFVGVPVVGILYAALLFFGESRLKRIPGNLYLSHVCLMAISVVGFDVTSMTSAVLDGVNTMVATLGLLGVCALLNSRFGVRGVLVPTGLGSFFPEIAVCYLICVLSLVGFPGTLGFIEEEVLLGQAVGHHNLLAAVIALALTLNGFSSFRLFARVFMGQPALGHDSETKLLPRERFIIYLIVAVIIVNGLAPSFIVDRLSHLGHS
jgi:hypothetical protein